MELLKVESAPSETKEETKPLPEKIAEGTEFEVKFRMDGSLLWDFKACVDKMEGLLEFIYVEGPDTYFVDGKGDFARYRKAERGPAREEVTFKYKPEGAKNNIVRTEYNWRVEGTPSVHIVGALNKMGYHLNFKITKQCHIYNFEDATVVFYTVIDTTNPLKPSRPEHFMEIEVSEEKLPSMTEAEAWGVVEKYEQKLVDLGISPYKRLKKSLFEMYRREAKK